MGDASHRFRLIVPLNESDKPQRYGSLNVFVGPTEVLFMEFCRTGEPSHAASTKALRALRRHCVQNDIEFLSKSPAPFGNASVPKFASLALRLAAVPPEKA